MKVGKLMTPVQLKAKVRNISREKQIEPHLVMRQYMMGKFLEQISESKYADNFVLKGGFLIESKYGIENRTTKDLDTTLRDMRVMKETVNNVFSDITSAPTKEGISFEIRSIRETREADYYPGFSLGIRAQLENMRTDFSIDVTTGDTIYPDSVKHKHKLMFEDREIFIEAYPTEQILAEKLSATFDFLTDNTRMKDFYDLYTIPKMEELNSAEDLKESVRRTFTQREKKERLKHYFEKDMNVIETSNELKKQWENYQKNNPFAEGIPYSDIVNSIKKLMSTVIQMEERDRKRDYKRSVQYQKEMER